jgi:hypothetical protein
VENAEYCAGHQASVAPTPGYAEPELERMHAAVNEGLRTDASNAMLSEIRCVIGANAWPRG